MKTTNQILILLAVLSLMSCHQLHVVTLYVDTENIDQSSIDTNAHFGQPMRIANKHYLTNVKKGDWIIWQGWDTSDKPNKVSITAIEHDSGDNIIDQKEVNTKNISNQQNSISFPKVFGKIKIVAGPGKKKDGEGNTITRYYLEEKYKLKFKVSNKPDDEFTIDPKIRSQ